MKKFSFAPFRDIAPYSENSKTIKRLNQRRKTIIDPFQKELVGARILDLGCHDGRWSYAMASCGAKQVVGIEGRQELIDRFSVLPETEFKQNVELRCGDLFEELEEFVASGEQFDVVALFGIFYHVMDHFLLLNRIQKLNPKLVIIDSEFIELDNAMIQLVTEDTENPLNAISTKEGQNRAVIGIPSKKATELMAEASGFELYWVDKDLVFGKNREGLHDYFRDHRKVRSTCYLIPMQRGH